MNVSRRDVVRVLSLLAVLTSVACNTLDPIGGQGNPDPGGSTQKLTYQYFLPATYNQGTSTRYPLIIALHGAGGLIADDNLIEVEAKKTAGFPFVVVAPSAGSRGWVNADLNQLYADVLVRFRIDPDRVYLTGLSMGAFGAWSFAVANPQRFAALALVSGGGTPADACTIKALPLWVFHNRDDPVVPLSDAEQIVSASRACGALPRFTVYDVVPDGTWAHNAWRAAWTSPELYDWFLANHRVP